MQLIGMLDSPYVRRVALTLRYLGMEFEHRPLSVFRDFDTLRTVNPLVKVPTLVLDDGRILLDSTLILDYLATQAAPRSRLCTVDGDDWVDAAFLLGVSLAAMEKVANLIYERTQRPESLRYQPWIDRTVLQLRGACEVLESRLEEPSRWLYGAQPSRTDIALAVCWRFIQLRAEADVPAKEYPRLVAYSARAEAQPEFRACPVD